MHYLEGLPPIGPFSFAQLWKIPILLYLITEVITYKKKEPFEKCAYWSAIETFFCPAILTNPFSIILYASKQLPLVLCFGYARKKFENKIDTLEKILYALAQFICLSSLITLLGIIEPIRGYRSADAFVTNMDYYSSVFTSTHAASSYFFIAAMVLINGFVLNKFNSIGSKIYNGVLLIVAFVSLFKAYTRTGWLMMAVAIIFYFDWRRINFKQAVKYFSILLTVIIGILCLYSSNDAFRARLAGQHRFGSEKKEAIDLGGSGRIDFWKNGIEQWSNNNVYSLLFGKGYDAVVEDNLREVGLRVFSHNQFIDSLTQYGLINLILLIAFYFYLYQFIELYGRSSPYYRLCRAVFFATLVFCFFQNEMYFIYAVTFALLVYLMQVTSMNPGHEVYSSPNSSQHGSKCRT